MGGATPPAYTPNALSSIKDQCTIVFIFKAENHTVTESSFDSPCMAITGAFRSGFVPSSGNIFPYMVAQYSCPSGNCAPLCKLEDPHPPLRMILLFI